MGTEAFVAAVGASLGAERVFPGHDRYATDWTGRYSVPSCTVVRPLSTDEVAAVVRLAIEHTVALVPQGGNTGLVGGGVPHHDEVVVSLEAMRGIGSVDTAARQVTAEAGVTIERLHEAAGIAGLRYPVDFGARGSATVGGSIATNAGGVNVLRYGMTRHQLVGIEAVLGTGEVVSHLGGLVKDNTGYDLGALLCGSEGTLGIVTKARLRLVPTPSHRATCLIGATDLDAAIRCTTALTSALDCVDAAELMLRSGMDLVTRISGLTNPLPDHDAYLLVECSADTDPTEAVGRIVSGIEGIAVVAASSAQQRRDLWRLREEHTPSINSLGAPIKFDVTVPVRAVPDFVRALHSNPTVVGEGRSLVVFGHAADGNLHVNVVRAHERDSDEIGDAVMTLVSGFGGSVSAEHGIGVAKKRWLSLSRSTTEITAMKSVKRALDPFGIMNPNVLFD